MKHVWMTIILLLSQVYFAFGQSTYIEDWSKFYETIENKMVGNWPHDNRFSDLAKLKELKYRWGFNHFLLQQKRGLESYKMAIQAGFDSSNIMRHIWQSNYQENIEEVPETWAYYIDEPADLEQYH